jgi:protein SCO1/2
MKAHVTLLLLCGTTLVALICAATVYRHRPIPTTPAAANQIYSVKGQIRGLEPDGITVRIAHENIPGFMPAMEMPFTVKDPALLHGFAPRDQVQFQLVVTKDDSWISRIEKICTEPSSQPASAGPDSSPADEFKVPSRAEVGQPVPDFGLIDQHGHPFHLRDFRGKAVVLTFIYTRCPLPNYCPLMSRNFASLQQRFAKEFPGKVQLLSISFDPQFDSPKVLQRYAALFQHSDQDWTFATGTPAQVDALSGLFGLIRERAGGFINHDLRTALISPEGNLVHVWRSNVWTPYEVQRRVQETLQPQLSRATPSASNFSAVP